MAASHGRRHSVQLWHCSWAHPSHIMCPVVVASWPHRPATAVSRPPVSPGSQYLPATTITPPHMRVWCRFEQSLCWSIIGCSICGGAGMFCSASVAPHCNIRAASLQRPGLAPSAPPGATAYTCLPITDIIMHNATCLWNCNTRHISDALCLLRCVLTHTHTWVRHTHSNA